MVPRTKVQTSLNPVPIVRGQLYALGGTVEHEGRISWVPADASGSAPLNSYVILEGDRGLLIDTNLPIMGESVVAQLRDLGLEKLTILMTRPVEFDSMGNSELIIRNFDVDRVYSELMFPPDDWVAFRDEGALPAFEPLVYRKGTDVEVFKGRSLNLVDARLKMLACAWVYDAKTRTLFTSDSFSHVMAQEPGGQLVTEDIDITTQAEVTAHLGAKFEWLRGSYTEPLRRFLNQVFDTYDVEIVAPSIGCVLKGRELVKRHHAMIDAALREFAEEENVA